MDEKTETDSKSHFKIILQKSSWYFLSSILTKAITIFLLPITTRYLNKSDFGILSNLDAINQLLPLFMSLLLDSAYYRFYFHYKDDHKKLKTYVSTYFWSILILGTIVFFLSVFIGGMFVTKLLEVPFYPVIPLTMISPLILQLSALGNSYTKQLLKSELNSVIVIGSYLIYIGVFVFLLVNKGLGYQAKLYALIVSNLLQFISFNYLLLKNNLIGFKFDKNILIEGLKYSLPLLPNTCSGWITSLSDRILITIFKNVEDSGVYSIGYMLGQGLTMFTGAIFNVYTPLMFSMLVKKKDESLKRIERFIPFYFFIMFWIAFVLGFFSKEAIYLLTDYKYHMAYMVTPIVAYAYFFGAMYKPFVNLIFFKNKLFNAVYPKVNGSAVVSIL